MHKKFLAILLSLMVALSLMPAAAFAYVSGSGDSEDQTVLNAADDDDDEYGDDDEEDGDEDSSSQVIGGDEDPEEAPDPVSYYIGESKSGSVDSGSSVVYRIETSMSNKACNVYVDNTTEDAGATLIFKITDANGNVKTELTADAAYNGGTASPSDAEAVIEMTAEYFSEGFYNLSTGDLIVLQAVNGDADYVLATQAINQQKTVKGGDFYEDYCYNQAQLIPLNVNGIPKKEIVYLENNSSNDCRAFIIRDDDDEWIEDSEGDEWIELQSDSNTDLAFTFEPSRKYWLVFFPLTDDADYSYDYDDDFDDVDDYDDDDYDYDDDDDEYMRALEIDYDEGDYDFAVAVSPQDLSFYEAKAVDVVYTGKARTQAANAKLWYGDIDLGNRCYKVSYKNNKNVGTAKMIYTAVAPYSGTKTVTFRIDPKGTSLKKLTAAKKAITVTWAKQAKQTTGYEIQYSLKKNFPAKKNVTKTVTVGKNTTVKTTIKKLAAKKTYFVRIRTFKKIGKTKYYSSWSKVKKIKTK